MAFLNVYQSGYYHRLNKPHQYNCHPGDLYPSYEAALNDVDPAAAHLYLGTFEVNIPASLLGDCNGPDSVPVPLSTSRRLLRDPSGLPSEVTLPKGWPEHIIGMRPLVKAVEDWPTHGSLETTEAEALHLTTQQIVSRWGAGEEGR